MERSLTSASAASRFPTAPSKSSGEAPSRHTPPPLPHPRPAPTPPLGHDLVGGTPPRSPAHQGRCTPGFKAGMRPWRRPPPRPPRRRPRPSLESTSCQTLLRAVSPGPGAPRTPRDRQAPGGHPPGVSSLPPGRWGQPAAVGLPLARGFSSVTLPRLHTPTMRSVLVHPFTRCPILEHCRHLTRTLVSVPRTARGDLSAAAPAPDAPCRQNCRSGGLSRLLLPRPPAGSQARASLPFTTSDAAPCAWSPSRLSGPGTWSGLQRRSDPLGGLGPRTGLCPQHVPGREGLPQTGVRLGPRGATRPGLSPPSQSPIYSNDSSVEQQRDRGTGRQAPHAVRGGVQTPTESGV